MPLISFKTSRHDRLPTTAIDVHESDQETMGIVSQDVTQNDDSDTLCCVVTYPANLSLTTEKSFAEIKQTTQTDAVISIADSADIGVHTEHPAFSLDVRGTGRYTETLRIDDRVIIGNGMGIKDFPGADETELSQVMFLQKGKLDGHHCIQTSHGDFPKENRFALKMHHVTHPAIQIIATDSLTSNVGINTEHPDFSLHVKGDSYTSGNQIVCQKIINNSFEIDTLSDSNSLKFRVIDETSGISLQPRQPALLTISAQTDDDKTMPNAPRVGINVEKPSATLDVDGDIRASGQLYVNGLTGGRIYQIYSPQNFSDSAQSDNVIEYSKSVPTGLNGRLILIYSNAHGSFSCSNAGIKINDLPCFPDSKFLGAQKPVRLQFSNIVQSQFHSVESADTCYAPSNGTLILDNATGPNPTLSLKLFKDSRLCSQVCEITIDAFFWESYEGGDAVMSLQGNRIGINVESPKHVFDVDGDINTSGQFLINGKACLLNDLSNNTSWKVATPSLCIDKAAIYFEEGSVGIGTDRPDGSYALDICGDVKITGDLTISPTDSFKPMQLLNGWKSSEGTIAQALKDSYGFVHLIGQIYNDAFNVDSESSIAIVPDKYHPLCPRKIMAGQIVKSETGIDQCGFGHLLINQNGAIMLTNSSMSGYVVILLDNLKFWAGK